MVRDGAATASYRVDVDRPTFMGAGRKQGHTGGSKCLAKDTELVLFLGKGIVFAGGSQPFPISIRELSKNTDS